MKTPPNQTAFESAPSKRDSTPSDPLQGWFNQRVRIDAFMAGQLVLLTVVIPLFVGGATR